MASLPPLDARGDGRLMCDVSRGRLGWRCERSILHPRCRLAFPWRSSWMCGATRRGHCNAQGQHRMSVEVELKAYFDNSIFYVQWRERWGDADKRG